MRACIAHTPHAPPRPRRWAWRPSGSRRPRPATTSSSPSPRTTDDGWPSDGAPGQYYDQRFADDFAVISPTPLTGVTWVGASENYLNPDLTNLESFVIEIFEDDGGLPGASLLRTTFDLAATDPVSIGTDGVSGAMLYRHRVSIDLSLNPGIYYLSISGVNVQPLDDAWIWNNAATPTNNSSFADIGVGVTHDFQAAIGTGDFAFDILSEVIACRGDVDCDGSVGADDLGLVIEAWGTSGGPADITGPVGVADGVVDIDDFIAVLLAWGPC